MKKYLIAFLLVLAASLQAADLQRPVQVFILAGQSNMEGQGVADVLFGDSKPTGKLTYSWPRSAAQIPIHATDTNYDPLFKLGYGLSY